MQTFTVEIDGIELEIVRDDDEKFIIPDEWRGIGSALKPANEPICLARKPLEQGLSIAANVLQHGTGAINIDGCRVGTDESTARISGVNAGVYGADNRRGMVRGGSEARWPANIIHDGSDEVIAAFPETATGFRPTQSTAEPNDEGRTIYGNGLGIQGVKPYDDSGSAARFFYTAKADSDDRLGSKHPTVKPVDLMQWLVRLVTPKGGLVLDPFAGTGTTAEACFREGMRCMLVEREAEYQADIRRRMALILSGPDERSRESIKAKLNGKPADHGPLFSGTL